MDYEPPAVRVLPRLSPIAARSSAAALRVAPCAAVGQRAGPSRSRRSSAPRSSPRVGPRAAVRPRPAARLRPHAEARAGTRSRPRASRSSQCASCAAAPLRSASGATRACPTRAWTSSPIPRPPSLRARPPPGPQFSRRRSRRCARARSRPAWSPCRSMIAGWTCARLPATRSSTARPTGRACAADDNPARRPGAARPAGRQLRREDPTRRQLGELAQREGVTIEPQIDVEDIESALELVARGTATRSSRTACWWNIGDRVPAKARLGAVRRADLRHVRLRLAPRRAALARRARVPVAGRGGAAQGAPTSCAAARRAAAGRGETEGTVPHSMRLRDRPPSHQAARRARPSA